MFESESARPASEQVHFKIT